SVGHKAEQFHDNVKIELLWTVIPTIILVVMAIPATKTMLEMDDVTEPELTIKVTGWQWKWEYDYLDSGVHFFSSLDA
ncbi:MAG: cytochrome c oxidase subunit II transmembrane domain-containing protein, partial [Methylococcales bacterium]|nr:cytochrome c oxidase subunit II transmembrane domain-containing protein [Methylococcales bacterium]